MALFLLGSDEQLVSLAAHVLTVCRLPEVAGRMGWIVGFALMRLERHDQALVEIDHALATHALPAMWSARLGALKAMILQIDGRFDDAETAAQGASEEAKVAGDRLALGYALHALSQLVRYRGGSAATSLKANDDALAVLGDEPEAADLRLLLLGNRAAGLANLGRSAEADDAFRQALVLAERAAPPRLGSLRSLAAGQWFQRGRWDEALAELEVVADLSLHTNHRLYAGGFRR